MAEDVNGTWPRGLIYGKTVPVLTRVSRGEACAELTGASNLCGLRTMPPAHTPAGNRGRAACAERQPPRRRRPHRAATGNRCSCGLLTAGFAGPLAENQSTTGLAT